MKGFWRTKAQVFVSFILIIAVVAPALVEDFPTYRFEMVKTFYPARREEIGKVKGISILCRYWIKGTMIRMERPLGEGRKRVALYRDGVEYRWVSPSNRAVMKWLSEPETLMHPSSGWIIHPEHLAHKLELLGAKKIGKERIEGKLCDVYEFKIVRSRGGRPRPPVTVRVWLWRAKRFPLREERTGVMEEIVKFSGKGKGNRYVKRRVPFTIIVEYKKVVIGKPIPDEVFALPKGIKFIEGQHVHRRLLKGKP